MTTKLDLTTSDPFGVQNLPYGVFTHGGHTRVGVRLDNSVLDVCSVPDAPFADAWATPSLNAFLALGRESWTTARTWLQDLVGDGDERPTIEQHLIPLADVQMEMPLVVGD